MPVNSFENYPMSWKPKLEELARPYYLSLANMLEREIAEGKLKAHTKLPPQRELADFLDLNLSTITRAYKVCELKGLLYAVTGSGTFVSSGVHSADTFIEKKNRYIEMGMIKRFTKPTALFWRRRSLFWDMRMLSGFLNITARWGRTDNLQPLSGGCKNIM